MTQAQVIALIQQWIVANGNNEITANVLRPILEAMVNQPNSLIGDLAELETIDNDTLVDAINSLLSQNILNRTALRFVSLIGINTEQDELYYVKQAINQNVIDNGQPYTCEPGEQMVFYTNIIVGVDGDGNFLTQTRYYRLLSGLTSVTSLPLITRIRYLMPDGDSQISILDPDSEIVVNLGNIGATAIHTAFNADASEPFEMNNDMFIVAQTSSGDKVWKWIGGVGLFGASATPAVAGDFVDLTEQPVVAGGGNFLQAQPITDGTRTLQPQDLNRTTTFINAVVVTIPNSVFIDETATRQQALLSFKDDWTINYPTTDGSDTLSGGAGALVYVERRNISNEWIVKRVNAPLPSEILGTLHNTIIGGVGGTINTKALLAAQLTGVSESDISNFFLVGNDIYAQINANYTGIGSGIANNTLTRFDDPTGRCRVGGSTWANRTGITRLVLNGIQTPGGITGLTSLTYFEAQNLSLVTGNFMRSTPLATFIVPKLRSMINTGTSMISNWTMANLNFPLLETIENPLGESGVMQGLTNADTIYMPNLRVLVSNTTSSPAFENLKAGCIITVHSDLATSNAGQMNAALQWAVDNRSAVIRFHQGLTEAMVVNTDSETDPDTLLAVKDDEVVQYDIDNINKYIIPTLTDNNEITFDRLRVFGELSDPRTGTLTDDLTGGLQGIVQKIYLDEDDIPAGWILTGGKLDDSGLNIIFCELNSEGDVEYWVTQEQ